MSEIEKHCPFCGCSEEKLKVDSIIISEKFTKDLMELFVKCPDCGARGPTNSFYNVTEKQYDEKYNDAIDKWNNRNFEIMYKKPTRKLIVKLIVNSIFSWRYCFAGDFFKECTFLKNFGPFKEGEFYSVIRIDFNTSTLEAWKGSYNENPKRIKINIIASTEEPFDNTFDLVDALEERILNYDLSSSTDNASILHLFKDSLYNAFSSKLSIIDTNGKTKWIGSKDQAKDFIYYCSILIYTRSDQFNNNDLIKLLFMSTIALLEFKYPRRLTGFQVLNHVRQNLLKLTKIDPPSELALKILSYLEEYPWERKVNKC